ncbi:hypothetical protein HO133_006643 [Letharia lupina]|uniref:Zn(2)-C6 fungal-type domain-containing protein n=1 Tax=Letharia lupina TaxID=560253 RepID=A0A8H6C6Z1_9LECA|nr:uncharacterized protein HO133_006643 [Letharia lupina]KAF6217816.1 hypothetical protein HO133_006643 [Letharia lupina]
MATPSFVDVGPSSQVDRALDNANNANDDAAGLKVAHTLTACCRCRTRKTRCDAGLPRCGPCERSNAVCEYFDTSKGKNIPRTYVIHLQNKVQSLEAELASLGIAEYETPDAESMIRSAGYVRFKENDESRYLGPSSGIAMTRLVMELAKQNTHTKSIKEIVPDNKARQIKDRFSKEEEKPTSKVYPLISDVAAPDLPSRDLTDELVDKFNQKAQYMLPTLHEPTFRDVVNDVYYGSPDPYMNFTLRMVIAISMQKLDTRYAGLADSYYLAALPFLEGAIRPMDLGTLQCFILMGQYSLVTPTRTAAYWVVGLAVKLCQELGITEEATIAPIINHRSQFSVLEIDMRRRMFWIITSMEFGLAHSLGRPSAFGTTFDHINVRWFEAVDDRFITNSGVTPGCPLSIKKRIAIHFFKMRLLQAEIRRKLYLKKRPEPQSDQDPWFREMQAKLEDWLVSGSTDDEGSGLSETWFKGRYNTMIVFLYRPSPQVPRPSVDAARRCFDASVFNIYMQRRQIASKSIDLTWAFTQSLFMALNAILWALSYPETRKEHPKAEVEKDINVAQEAIYLASQRWPGVESALELYDHLVVACLNVYEGIGETSYIVDLASNKTSPASFSDAVTPPSLSSQYSPGNSKSSPRHKQKAPHLSPSGYVDYDKGHGPRMSPTPSEYSLESGISGSFQSVASQQPSLHMSNTYQASPYDPDSLYNSFPSMLSHQPYLTPQYSHTQNLGSIGEHYSQYLHAPYVPHQPLLTLNQEQQTELMRNLETDGIERG